MTSPGSSRSRRGSVLPNEWPPRHTVYDNCGKNSTIKDGLANIPDDYYWRDDERARRHEGTKFSFSPQDDVTSDHQLYNVPEERSSDEDSLTETEVNDNERGDVPPTYRRYETTPKKCDKTSMEYPSYTGINDQSTLAPQSQRNFKDYAKTVNLPQALTAMRKLECLKELQRRRDLAERFYSQEIRRLIGEHFFTGSSTVDPIIGKTRERINEAATDGETRMRAGAFVKKLEPCGTMTTITRLDCGCVKETTRPIFNSSAGHVQKCDGHLYQERAIPKFASTYPQELTYISREPLTSPTGAKETFLPDSGAHKKPPCTVSRDLESWNDRRAISAQARIRKSPRNQSSVRTTSPVRKHSDPSSNELP